MFYTCTSLLKHTTKICSTSGHYGSTHYKLSGNITKVTFSLKILSKEESESSSRKYPDFQSYINISYGNANLTKFCVVLWVYIFINHTELLINYTVATVLPKKINIQRFRVMLHFLLVFSVSVYRWIESLFYCSCNLKLFWCFWWIETV